MVDIVYIKNKCSGVNNLRTIIVHCCINKDKLKSIINNVITQKVSWSIRGKGDVTMIDHEETINHKKGVHVINYDELIDHKEKVRWLSRVSKLI